MIVEQVFLFNFRNYERLDIRFGGVVNLFLGNNAQGKTNLLEAVEVAVTAHSSRTIRDAELIRWGAPGYYLKAITALNGTKRVAEVSYCKERGKLVKLDGLAVKSTAGFDMVPVVSFSPEDLMLVKGPPALRRKYVDVQAIRSSTTFRKDLAALARVFFQRNSLLRTGMVKSDRSGNSLDVWDEQLASLSIRVMKMRHNVVKMLSPIITEIFRGLSGSGTLEISYAPAIESPGGSDIPSIDDIKEQLRKVRPIDYARHTTTLGPHKDDFRLTLDGVDLRVYGSQGQQRTAALAMKFAELDLLARYSEDRPVLLLDDVFSELDAGHRVALAQIVRKSSQTFITCTDSDTLPGISHDLSVYRIENGNVSYTRGNSHADDCPLEIRPQEKHTEARD